MIVVIPIHNQIRNIGIVLNAYLDQTQMPTDVILVLDKCTDGSETVIPLYTDAFTRKGSTLHAVDTAGSTCKGFGAGRTRDVGIQYATSRGLLGPFLFTDGDCVPSSTLVEHHAIQLSVTQARITCGLRYETIPNDTKPDYPLTGDMLLSMRVQSDLRMYAAWCIDLVFGATYDRLVVNPRVFAQSWICWSCNLGMNQAAVEQLQAVNGYMDGDVQRVFNSSFDGRWGGEDGFVGMSMFYTGRETVALSQISWVTHIYHSRGHTNPEHLRALAGKGQSLSDHCDDGVFPCDATSMTGLRELLVEDQVDLGFLETLASLQPNTILTKILPLLDGGNQFLNPMAQLMLSGSLLFKGAVPTFKYDGDPVELGKQALWARDAVQKLKIGVDQNIYSLITMPEYGA